MKTELTRELIAFQNKVRRRLGDIQLFRAMLAWNPSAFGEDGRMMVLPHPDGDHWCDRLGLSSTAGACCAHWGAATKQTRLALLMIEAWHIACRDGVPLKSIHAALMVVPEYRETLSEDFAVSKSPKRLNGLLGLN